MQIRFGTSGWRSVIADEFTFDNVRKVTNAICSSLKTKDFLVIGHDTRFMGEKFAAIAAQMASDRGLKVLLCNAPVPTPTIAHAIRSRGAAGAINFTASHNPPEYQGIKFSTADGAPALPETTDKIEQLIRENLNAVRLDGGSIEEFDPCPAYLDDLRSKIRFEVIANAGLGFGYDPLWGTGRGYLDRVLREYGLDVETIHDWRDVTFGGRSPEPGEDHLGELKELVTSKKMSLGLATDGDGDRFGIIDSDGKFIEPNYLIALVADYLAESRQWKKGLARSVATSHMIDRVAESRGLKLYETPVGFKYIGELIIKDEVILGGEESAGLSIRGHYPEKDGILACLLAAEAVAERKANLSEQLNELFARVGRLESGRIGVKLTPDIAEKLKKKFEEETTRIGGRKITSINRIDGVKFYFENSSWMLMRPSGTEPMVRIYAESESKQEVRKLLEDGRQFLLG